MNLPPVVFGKRGDIEYSLFRESDWEGVKEIVLSSFCMYEPICRGCAMDLPENEASRQEVAAVALVLLRNGVSLVARDVTNGKIVGHCINTFKTYDKEGKLHYYADFDKYIGAYPCSKAYMDFDVPVNMLKVHNVECSFDIGFLGISADYKKAGIGRALCEYSIELARRMKDGEFFEYASEAIRAAGLRPQVIGAMFTSSFSRRIGEQLGFVPIDKVDFADVQYDGKTMAEWINDERHSAAVVMSIRL